MRLSEGESLPGSERQNDQQALNNRINISWHQISVEEICKSISGWKKWLHLVMEEDRGHMEHRLK